MFYLYTTRRRKFRIKFFAASLAVAVIFAQAVPVGGSLYADTTTDESTTSSQPTEKASVEPSKEDVTTSENKDTETSPAPEEQAGTKAQSQEAPSQITEPQVEPAAQQTSPELSVEVTNDSTAENNVGATANSGSNSTENNSQNDSQSQANENEADQQQPTTQTGNANSQSVLINEQNTTVVSDNFAEITLQVGSGDENVDLMKTLEDLLANPQSGLVAAPTAEITVTNDAQTSNEISADANTGENVITNKTGLITTGDATSQSAVVNQVNTTLIGNNWIFAVINIIGDWSGDLIVPGLDVVNLPETASVGGLDVSIDNSALTENVLASSANTGENSGKNILTGDAVALINTVTVENTTIIENNWLGITVNNLENPNVNDNTHTSLDSDAKESFTSNQIDIAIKNNALVQNNLSSTADSGNNVAESAFAAIKTGVATAKTGVVNFINTTIIGNNWVYVIVNVFGSWKGKIKYAYPDLEISGQLDKNQIYAGQNAEYTVTVSNNGDASAENIEVETLYPSELILKTDEQLSIGTLGPGETKQIRFEVSLEKTPIETDTENIKAIASTTTNEPSLENNTFETYITILPDLEITSAKLKLTRSKADAGLSPGGQVTHEILVKNSGETPLYNVFVRDTVFDPFNNKIGVYEWPISEIKPDEEYVITYTLAISSSAPAGTYTNRARAEGRTPSDELVRSDRSLLSLLVSAPVVYASSVEVSPDELVSNDAPANLTDAVESSAPSKFPLIYWLAAILGIAALESKKLYSKLKSLKPTS